MEKRKTVMTTLILTSALFSVVMDTNAANYSIFFGKSKNERKNLNQVEVPHDHLPEGEMNYNTIRKKHQFLSLVEI